MRHRERRSPAAASTWLRTGLSCLFALAIIFQGAVLQSHIHAAPPLAEVAHANTPIIGVAEGAGPSRGNHAPAKGDPVNCYFCQQLKLTGATVLPVSLALAKVEHFASLERVLSDASSTVEAISHAWRSRAPPLSI